MSLAAKAFAASVAVVVLGLAGCGGSEPTAFSGVTHAPYAVSSTPLTSTDGAMLALTDFSKPLTLVFFGYTHCEDFCPMVMNNLAVALTRLSTSDRAKVDLVFITSDPARDTPAVLSKYLGRYGEGLIGLTGALPDVVAVGRSLAVSIDDGTKLPDGGYDLASHSTTVSALTPDHTSGILWTMDTSAAEFAADFTAILHGKAPSAS